ncbi:MULTISPECIES: FAD/NAD(P)-binding protein [unclassified Sinorhizobium]|uniref:FAD/NAD(P)-binding protein n=1 Tax=unclassified Sinorhizobium TaxID=2613772 RepID=UPI00352387D8
MAYDVVVVGSGFSAIAVTINLLCLLPATRSIAVVGDDPGFGRGTAYRTEFYLHRLNVPAGRMSVFPDRSNDFIEWLHRRGSAISADEFASRGDYGLYLRDTLAALLRGRDSRARIDFIKAKAAGCVERFSIGMVFQLDNGAQLTARKVVLCLGVGNAQLPVSCNHLAPLSKSRIVVNPWKLSWLSHVGTQDRVCILGSGLTMIDQVVALRAHGHRGRIDVLSRRGLLPHSHQIQRTIPVEPQFPAGTREISILLSALRRQVRHGANWRAVMDGLRPRTQELWQELTSQQRSRFLRHALPWWNIHRHRISPAIFERFDALVRSDTVIVHAGFLEAIAEATAGMVLSYRPRKSGSTASLHADWIVNCTGMERAGLGHSPLLKEMLEQGMIRADELGLGLEVDRDSRVLGADRQVQKDIFAVGALTAGQFWEITAVPDIRVQAKHVADAIASGMS